MPDNAMVGQIQSDDGSSTDNPRSFSDPLGFFSGSKQGKARDLLDLDLYSRKSVCDLERQRIVF